jgi:hypothetical protein
MGFAGLGFSSKLTKLPLIPFNICQNNNCRHVYQ